MEEVYRNSSKVVVDTSGRNGSSLMYLPLDKLVEQSANKAAGRSQNTAGNATATATPPQPQATAPATSHPLSQSSSLRPGRGDIR